MTNPTDIRTLADLRVEQAEYLLTGKHADAAFYLGGYAVELYLKAKICENLNIPHFYSQYAPKSDLSKIFLVHNLERLIVLSGLLPKFEAEKITNPVFLTDWQRLERWSEKSRYEDPNLYSLANSTLFIQSVKNITQWIKMN